MSFFSGRKDQQPEARRVEPNRIVQPPAARPVGSNRREPLVPQQHLDASGTAAVRPAPAVQQQRPVVQVPPIVERTMARLVQQLEKATERIESLEHRVDELTEMLANAPSHSDVLEVRLHSAKLAAELARTTVELRGEIGMAADENRRNVRAAVMREPEVVVQSPPPGWTNEHPAGSAWATHIPRPEAAHGQAGAQETA